VTASSTPLLVSSSLLLQPGLFLLLASSFTQPHFALSISYQPLPSSTIPALLISFDPLLPFSGLLKVAMAIVAADLESSLPIWAQA